MLKNLYGGDLVERTQTELNAMLAAHERYSLYQGGQRALLAHADLSGLNLANRKLMEADFSGASLFGANLYGSNLERATLYCADLRSCNLQLANLVRADLRGASFKDAKLSYAILDQADMRSAMMMYAGGETSSKEERSRRANGGSAGDSADAGSGVDFSYCSMKGVSFGNAKLSGVNFTGALLHGANFKNARLTNVTFKNAVLTGVNLKELMVPTPALVGCVLDVTPEANAKFDEIRSRLDAHELWLTTNGKRGALAVLNGEDLRPMSDMLVARELTGLSARNTNCIGLNFSGSQLQAAKFDGADLRDANFSECDLRGASLRASKIAHAKFDKANLSRLRLTDGTTLVLDLTEAEGSGQQFYGAILEDQPFGLSVAAS